jgi:hypothetical protein
MRDLEVVVSVLDTLSNVHIVLNILDGHHICNCIETHKNS